jgi:hypothetical protein
MQHLHISVMQQCASVAATTHKLCTETAITLTDDGICKIYQAAAATALLRYNQHTVAVVKRRRENHACFSLHQ